MKKSEIRAAFSGTSASAGSVTLDGDHWVRAFAWQDDSDWINDRTDERINYKVMLEHLNAQSPNELESP